MADPTAVAQQIFSVLTGQVSGQPNCNPSTPNNATTTATPAPGLPAAMPTSFDISSIITLLFSLGALRDWLKLFVIGTLLETARRLAFQLYYKIYNSFFITAFFEDTDMSYNWMMIWLSQQPAWSKARDVQINTRSYGLDKDSTVIEGEEEELHDALNQSRKLNYLPSVSTVFSFWYKHRWVRITRDVKESNNYYQSRIESITVCILARDHSILNEMLLDAKKAYKESQRNLISIYVSDSSNSWRHVASRPKRPLNSIVLDPGIKDLIIDDARDFLESKDWYLARGIPFRRGYLLYGPPGTGKTSIIHSLAGELGLDVYIVSLSRAGLDDTGLGELISELPEKCIALMEDIDAAFGQTIKRDLNEDESEDEEDDKKKKPKANVDPMAKPTSRISLSGLLNALDGVGAQEGRILFATTNKYSALDPALCRPGRMDIHIEFNYASKYQAHELFNCFYVPESESKNAASENAADEEADLDEKASNVADQSTVITSSADAKNASGVARKRRRIKFSSKLITELAALFSEAIPEREFSMAALQGYLMSYKTRPRDAVQNAAAWVAKERLDAAMKKAKEEKGHKASSSHSSTPASSPESTEDAEIV